MAHKNKTNWSPYKARNKNASGSTSTKNNLARRVPHESFSDSEAEDRLRDLFERHGLTWVSYAQRRKLALFFRYLMENQSERNFTRLLTLREVGIKHFVDSLMILPLLEASGTPLLFPLMDVGTGPGFPGIPLKIALPDRHIYLAEGVQKRVDFLKDMRERLELSTPQGPLEIYARNVNQECFLPVNGIITRAVEDATNTLGNVIHSLQTGGRVYLMKGPHCEPEIEPALKKWGDYYVLEKDIAYEIKNSPHQRRLLVFQKIKPHPLPDFEALDLAWEAEHGQ